MFKRILIAASFAASLIGGASAQINNPGVNVQGAFTTGNCAKIMGRNTIQDAGAPCGGAPAAMTKTDDTNVTMTLTGTPATALLQAVGLQLGWTGTLSQARGGWGQSIAAVNGIPNFTAGVAAFAAPGNVTKADDTNVTMTLGGTPTGAALNAFSMTLGWTGTLSKTRGGLGGAITAVRAGDLIYLDGSGVPQILGGNNSGGKCLAESSAGVPAWGNCSNFLYDLVALGAVSGADTASRNSNAIAAAITACATNPGTIWVPAGNYQFATAWQIQTSGCSFAGEGPGASILTYTGVSIGGVVGPSSGSNVTGISFKNVGLVCSSTCSRIIQVQDVEQNIVFDNVYMSGGSAAETVRVTSNTTTTQGSYSVHFIGGTVIANCGTVCLSINPQGVALAQAIFVDHVFFNGYGAQALYITSGSGVFVSNSRFERHPGISNTGIPIHVDTTSKLVFRDNYVEDEANSIAFEIGGSVAAVDILNNYFTLNNTGGSATSAYAIKHNGSGTPVMINIRGNTFVAAGTMAKIVDFSAAIASHINVAENYVNIGNATTVFDFGSSTQSTALNNRIQVGTVSTGIASAVGQSAVAACGNSYSGTFSVSQSNVGQCISTTGATTAGFTTNWMGQVTVR